MADGLDEPENCCTRSKAQAERQTQDILALLSGPDASQCRLLGCVFPRYVSPASLLAWGVATYLSLEGGQPGAWMNARDAQGASRLTPVITFSPA
jgi:hypothetical protein